MSVRFDTGEFHMKMNLILFAVLPDIETKPKKSTFEVPLKAVEWALGYLDSYVRFKNHMDLDARVKL